MKRLVLHVLVFTGIYALIWAVWVLWEIRHQGYITTRSSDTITATIISTVLTEWIMDWAYPSDPNR